MLVSRPYPPVEYSTSPTDPSPFLLDAASRASILWTISLFAAFLILQLAIALRTPSYFSHGSESYRFAEKTGNATLEMDFRLSDFGRTPGFVSVNCSLISQVSTDDRVLPLRIGVRSAVFHDGRAIESVSDPFYLTRVTFSNGRSKSSPIPLSRLRLPPGGQVELGVAVEADCTTLIAFLFDWEFLNSATLEYLGRLHLAMAILTGYLFAVYAWNLIFEQKQFSQGLLLGVGLAAVFASNPIGAVLSNLVFSPSEAGCALQALFTALYRFLLCAELRRLRGALPPPRSAFFVLLALFVTAQAAAEASASHERLTRLFAGIAPVLMLSVADGVACAVRAVYLCFSSALLASAVARGSGAQRRRIALLGGSLVATDIATLADCAPMASVLPAVLYGATHSLCASLLLFFFRPPAAPAYVSLAEHGGADIGEPSGDSEEDDRSD
jgi:hypothetical protein